MPAPGDTTLRLALQRGLLLIVCVVVIAVVGVMDLRSDGQLTLSLFYVVPVAMAAWWSGGWAGAPMAVYAIAVWSAAEYVTFDQSLASGVPWWNAGVRLVFFLAVVLVVAALRSALANERLLARRDETTGIANAREFRERSAYEVRRLGLLGAPLCVAIADVDNLKEVNDTCGHGEGDALLTVVAETLRGTLRRRDLVARLGGDEFGLLLPDTDPAAAGVALGKARDSVNAALASAGWPATLSIGGVCTHLPVREVQVLLDRADEYLYSIKEAGRNGLVVGAMGDETAGARVPDAVSSVKRKVNHE